MIDAHLNKTALQPPEIYIGRVGQEKFRLVICLSKGRGELGVVDLPQGDLCVRSPEVHFCSEDIFPELHLHAELKLGFGILDLCPRVGFLISCLFLIEIVRVGKDIVLAVRHDGEPAPATFVVELPHSGEDGNPGSRNRRLLRLGLCNRCIRRVRLFWLTARCFVVTAKTQGVVVDIRACFKTLGGIDRLRSAQHSNETGKQAARKKTKSVHTPSPYINSIYENMPALRQDFEANRPLFSQTADPLPCQILHRTENSSSRII